MIPPCWPNFWKNYNWNPKSVWGRPQERCRDLISRLDMHSQEQAYYVLGFHQKTGNSWTQSTECNYPGCELLRASCFFHFLSADLPLPQVQQIFLSNYCILQVLVRTWLFFLLQKSLGSKSQALSVVSQQPPSQGVRRKEDDDPHMNLCTVLVKDLKKQKAKLNFMAK